MQKYDKTGSRNYYLCNINEKPLLTFMLGTAFEITGLVLVYLFVLFTVFRIIMDTTNTHKAYGYLLITFILPVIGSLIYFTFGVNYRKKKIYNKKLAADDLLWQRVSDKLISNSEEIRKKYQDRLKNHNSIVNLLVNDVEEPVSANYVKLLFNGENKFPEVLEALENAQKTIHIQYYIYEEFGIGSLIAKVLKEKARAGVQVRMLYDDYGTSLSRTFIEELREAGVEMHPFFRVRFPIVASRINYRNHRKVIIIDGKVGFFGGLNIAERYINGPGKTGPYWRDTHVRVGGPVVLRLQYHFLADWNFCAGENLLPDEELFPNLEEPDNSNALMQVVSSGPDCPRPSIMLSYFAAINDARSRVYITTPYFIPSESIYYAIKAAALAGKDVRILLPEKSDSKLVTFASNSYYDDLLDSGVAIYQYKKGVIHSKTLIVDHDLSVVGSANMDYRSFDFNFELNGMIYSEEICTELTHAFFEDLENSKKIDPFIWRKRSKLIHLRDRGARLLSPLM